MSCTTDNSDSGLKIYGGYQFNSNIAGEGGDVDLGEATLTANSDGSGPVWPPGAIESTGEAKGFLLQGVVGGNVHERVYLFASAGLLLTNTDVNASDAEISISDST